MGWWSYFCDSCLLSALHSNAVAHGRPRIVLRVEDRYSKIQGIEIVLGVRFSLGVGLEQSVNMIL
jgi:hypothetical protein